MGKILIYDDEEKIVELLKSSIRGLNLGLKPIVFTEYTILRDYIYSNENWDDVKGIIFDLAQKKEEDSGITDFEILEEIRWCYENRRVPILIHSAYANDLDVLKQYPSIFLIKKGAQSIKTVRDTIAILENSGFLDLFCEGPLLKDEVKHQNLKMEWGDELLKKHLHSSFVNVFKGDDLINQLLEIMETEDPKRNCFLKFLNPVIESLKDMDKK